MIPAPGGRVFYSLEFARYLSRRGVYRRGWYHEKFSSLVGGGFFCWVESWFAADQMGRWLVKPLWA